MYNAILTTIKDIQPHPNADRLLLTNLLGYDCIVGKDTVVGDRVVLFPPDGQLSEEYANKNDLIARKDPVTGERAGGFFDESRRVKATRLRSMKSQAFVANISSFEYTGFDLNAQKDGFSFCELAGHQICNKYFTQATLRAIASQGKIQKENEYFRKHIDTEKLEPHIFKIKPGALIFISLKLHGTSARGGLVPSYDSIPKWKEFINRIFGPIFQYPSSYKYLMGSRNVVLTEHNIGSSYYGSTREEFRKKAFDSFKERLFKNEIVYSELVGYASPSTPIMGEVSTSKIGDKSFAKEYGPKMLFNYGCAPGEFDQYIYRITHTTPDNVPFDLSYFQMVKRAQELGVKTPPLLAEPFIYNGNPEQLIDLVNGLTEGRDPIGKTHIREGVVVRVENPDGTIIFLKSKSFTFYVLEGVLKDDSNYVDTEEAS